MIKILIVDDSTFSQKVHARLISNYLNEAEIFYANDGAEGFERYKEIKPDYVLLDLLMPNVNGKEAISHIMEYDPNAKVFVVSADIQKNVRNEICKYNIIDFVNKPLNEEKAKTICEYIRNDLNG